MELARVGQGARWLEKFSDVAEFARLHGRLPRSNSRRRDEPTGERENKLGEWLRHQRRPRVQQALSRQQVELLENLPGFSWDPLGDEWDERLGAVESFVLVHRRFPRYRSDEREEKRLAAWVARQRALAAKGRLPYGRVKELREIGVIAAEM